MIRGAPRTLRGERSARSPGGPVEPIARTSHASRPPLPRRHPVKDGKPEGQYFRAGAGAVICDAAGRVLALERADVPGAWQLPQGGLRADEEPLQAAYREVAEETGIPPEALELVARHPEPLAYELPPEARRAKTGRGQVQYWYLFRVRDPSVAPDLPEDGEFRDWRWMAISDLAPSVVAFRRPVYERLARYFEPFLGGPQPTV